MDTYFICDPSKTVRGEFQATLSQVKEMELPYGWFIVKGKDEDHHAYVIYDDAGHTQTAITATPPQMANIDLPKGWFWCQAF